MSLKGGYYTFTNGTQTFMEFWGEGGFKGNYCDITYPQPGTLLSLIPYDNLYLNKNATQGEAEKLALTINSITNTSCRIVSNANAGSIFYRGLLKL